MGKQQSNRLPENKMGVKLLWKERRKCEQMVSTMTREMSITFPVFKNVPTFTTINVYNEQSRAFSVHSEILFHFELLYLFHFELFIPFF